jgi:hypothetical protein
MIISSVMIMDATPARGPINRDEKVIKARKKNSESPRIPVSVRLLSPRTSGSKTNIVAFNDIR